MGGKLSWTSDYDLDVCCCSPVSFFVDLRSITPILIRFFLYEKVGTGRIPKKRCPTQRHTFPHKPHFTTRPFGCMQKVILHECSRLIYPYCLYKILHTRAPFLHRFVYGTSPAEYMRKARGIIRKSFIHSFTIISPQLAETDSELARLPPVFGNIVLQKQVNAHNNKNNVNSTGEPHPLVLFPLFLQPPTSPHLTNTRN